MIRNTERLIKEERARLQRELLYWKWVRAALIGLVIGSIFWLPRLVRAEDQQDDDQQAYEQEDGNIYARDYSKKEGEVKTLPDGRTVVYSRDFSKVVAEVRKK